LGKFSIAANPTARFPPLGGKILCGDPRLLFRPSSALLANGLGQGAAKPWAEKIEKG
jgi:hypothetical protein